MIQELNPKRDVYIFKLKPWDWDLLPSACQGPHPGSRDLLACAGHGPPGPRDLLASAGHGPPGPRDLLASAGQGPFCLNYVTF